MRHLLLIATLALSGCISAASPATQPLSPEQAAPPAPAELYRGTHAFDKPPISEIEVKDKVVVPAGTTSLAFHLEWSSASGLAATIPKGAAVKLKDPSHATLASSSLGPGPLPGKLDKPIEAPAAGEWIVEYEGFAPGVSASVTIRSL